MSSVVQFPRQQAAPDLANDNGDKLTLFGFGSWGFTSVCFLLPGSKPGEDRHVSVDIVTHQGRRRIEPYARWQLSEGPDVEPEYLPVDCREECPHFICQYITDLIGRAKKGDENAIERLREFAEEGWHAVREAKEERELYGD